MNTQIQNYNEPQDSKFKLVDLVQNQDVPHGQDMVQKNPIEHESKDEKEPCQNNKMSNSDEKNIADLNKDSQNPQLDDQQLSQDLTKSKPLPDAQIKDQDIKSQLPPNNQSKIDIFKENLLPLDKQSSSLLQIHIQNGYNPSQINEKSEKSKIEENDQSLRTAQNLFTSLNAPSNRSHNNQLDLEQNMFTSIKEQDGDMIRAAKAINMLSPTQDAKKKDIEEDCQLIMDYKFKKWLSNANFKHKMQSPAVIKPEKQNSHGPGSGCTISKRKSKSKFRISKTIEQLMPYLGSNLDQHNELPNLSSYSSDSSSSSQSEMINGLTGENNRQKKQNDNDQNQISFNVDDLESLQDAEIDNRLLEFYFLTPSKQEVIKREILLKHARNFGYYMIPKEKLYEAKYRHTYEKKEEYYNQKYEIEQKIKELSNEIFLIKKKQAEHEIF